MCSDAVVDQARHQLLHLLTNTVLDLQHIPHRRQQPPASEPDCRPHGMLPALTARGCAASSPGCAGRGSKVPVRPLKQPVTAGAPPGSAAASGAAGQQAATNHGSKRQPTTCTAGHNIMLAVKEGCCKAQAACSMHTKHVRCARRTGHTQSSDRAHKGCPSASP